MFYIDYICKSSRTGAFFTAMSDHQRAEIFAENDVRVRQIEHLAR